jgi:uncharacterized protein YndB with AHSA1/START domain
VSVEAIERDGRFVVLRCERPLPCPVERAWAAITEPERIEHWLGRRPQLDLRPGGEHVIDHGAGLRVVDRVLRVEPPTVLEHTFWASVNPDARVLWILRGTTEGCRLTFTHRMSDADIENAAATIAAGDDRGRIIARNAAGWRRLLDSLAVSLAVPPDRAA